MGEWGDGRRKKGDGSSNLFEPVGLKPHFQNRLFSQWQKEKGIYKIESFK